MSNELVIEAISSRRMLSFSYAGAPRKVMPARLGTNRRGRQTVHAYQVSGGSSSGTPPQWRNFRVDRMSDVTLDEAFPSDPPGLSREPYFTVLNAELGRGLVATTGPLPPPPPGRPAPAATPSSDASAGPAGVATPDVAEMAEKVIGAVSKWFKKRG